MTADETRYKISIASVDGGIVPIAETKISLLDRGFLHSDATCDIAMSGGAVSSPTEGG